MWVKSQDGEYYNLDDFINIYITGNLIFADTIHTGKVILGEYDTPEDCEKAIQDLLGAKLYKMED